MNGIIDRRPIITCAGELEVFSTLEENLTNSLPNDFCEWKRSLGRPIRNVRIGAKFIPFSVCALPKNTQWDLIKKPLFHTYWTECNDVDIYKSTVREDIENWLKELNAREIKDWLIIVVENYDGKRTKQLLIPRTTVLDKIRTDFALKHGDHCISVVNPGKSEQHKTAESWRGLITRIRYLLLVAYARAVSQLEDYVRQQRERRNEPGWNFINYFFLQEELAQVLEMLGLNDEALVQYDELDALFSQFVANFNTCDNLKWLLQFQRPLEKWHGLKLVETQLIEATPSLLELRSYIFSRQSQMLLQSKKIWEMASRCLPFLHTCVREINILEISTPPGALSCWLFLSTLQVLQICDKFNQADQVEEYSLHTASLWEYSSQKLRNLGELCGLMPKLTPTSEQLHIVVSLSAGMGDNLGPLHQPSPTDRLKEALCSQDVFISTYLEFAELAMGTYKHVGRLRKARLVGKEVANFYLLLGETQKAAAFLNDTIRTLQLDGWHELAAETQLSLADCYRKKIEDIRKFIRTCANIAATLEMDNLIRWTYFDEMVKYVQELDKPLEMPFNDIITIDSVHIISDLIIMQGCNIEIELIVESNFPKEFLSNYIGVNLIKNEETDGSSTNNNSKEDGKFLNKNELTWQDPLIQKLEIQRTLEYKQDKQLASSSITGRLTQKLCRKESIIPQYKIPTGVQHTALKSEKLPLLLTPGLNSIKLFHNASELGKFQLDSIEIELFDKLKLTSNQLLTRLTVEVREENPSIRLYKRSAPLISGVEQTMNLILTIGSYPIPSDSVIKLCASSGLAFQLGALKDKPLTNILDIPVGVKETFSSTKIPLRILAEELLTMKDHQVTIYVPWISKPVIVGLSFSSPMSTTWRLFTVSERKFIQVNVVGHCVDNLIVEKPELKIKEFKTDPKHLPQSSSLMISNGLSYSFLWEILVNKLMIDQDAIKTEFLLQYKLNADDFYKTYHYYFDLLDYQTLFLVDAVVEPSSNNEFCRIGIGCHLNLTITNLTKRLKVSSIMYEILAEQNVWAVIGRTAGVLTFSNNEELFSKQEILLDVMPLTSGFLPLPFIRISKYIPAESSNNKDIQPKLEPFNSGQVYNRSKGKQVYVIGAISE